MGQLIKLQDYVSRYEQNIFHYPSRFVMLKKQQWEKWQNLWMNAVEFEYPSLSIENKPHLTDEKKQPKLGKLINLFQRKQNDQHINEEIPDYHDLSILSNHIESLEINDFPTFFHRPETMDELKKQYLNHLFQYQIKWATSTLKEKSSVNKKYLFDEKLKYFLQRFPDTYLVLYRPIFLLKKASVEVECILISPTDVWCITFLEDHDSSVFKGSNEKFWTVQNPHSEKKILNPIIALNRTEKITKTIFKLHEIDLPIHKVLLSRNGYIDYPSPPYDVNIIEKRRYDEWFQSLRRLRSPIKSTQLKGAKALLEFCQTTSIRRQEWEETDNI